MVTYPLGSGVGRSTPLVTMAPIAAEANSLSRLGVDACSKSAHSVLGSDTISTRPGFGVAAPAGAGAAASAMRATTATASEPAAARTPRRPLTTGDAGAGGRGVTSGP